MTPLFSSHYGEQPAGSHSVLRLWLLLAIFLCPVASIADKSAADYFVSSLPGQPEGPLLKMHAGHIEVSSEHHGNLFFWHFQNRHIANRQRTVLWLNGGPGCSSMDGALMEIGPYRLKDQETLEYNEGSWDEFANLLFVDNPVGTGYSYVDTNSYVHELQEMADQMILFLEKFFILFPEYSTDDIYIGGESYAGQHIPYIAQSMLDRNRKSPNKPQWKLSGLLIGNGWIAPVEQYNSYLDFAYKEDLIQGGSDVAQEVEAQMGACNRGLNDAGGNEVVGLPQCEAVLTTMLRRTTKNGRCTNMYDIRLTDVEMSCGMNWPPDLESVTPYLRRNDVVQALHVDHSKRTGWTECTGAVGSAFTGVNSKPSVQLLPSLLEQMPVILFSGAEDLICNHIGTEAFIHNMEWNGGKGFELSPGTWAPRRDWTFEGEPAGFYQEARNLTYILFYNASHMVPFDYSRRSRDMLDRFIGVDIASIGGVPADSRIDGEKGLETSVGGHPNSTAAEEAEKEKLEDAKWDAYYRSGEAALVVVIIVVGIGGFYVWRDRRRRTGYVGLFGGAPNGHVMLGRRETAPGGGIGLERFKFNRGGRDVEAADFDESELDDLHAPDPSPTNGGMHQERYSVGGTSSDEEDSGRYKDKTGKRR